MRLTAGTLVHRDEKYLERCLETLVSQEGLGTLGTDWQIVVRDNAAPDKDYILRAKKRFPQVQFLLNRDNAGYARGHNEIMREFPAEFHAVLNNDILFQPDFLSKLLEELVNNPQAGSVVGKLLRWDFESDKKTHTIDSTGIAASRSQMFTDRGQGEEDTGQYDEKRECFGGSGAAVIYRRSALEEIAYHDPEEFFDEIMWMYKEDVDLAYRLVTVGKPCRYVPDAVAWHDRTAGSHIKRKDRSKRERKGSAAHELIILRKHSSWLPFSLRFKGTLRQILKGAYLLLREPDVFFGACGILREKKEEIQKKSMHTKHTVSFAEVSHLFL